MQLIEEINEDEKYLIIYRKNKCKNIEAYIRLKFWGSGFENNRTALPDYFFDHKENLLMVKKLNNYYEKFIEKYNDSLSNVLIIFSEDIENDLIGVFQKIISFLGIDLDNQTITVMNNVIDETKLQFSHYDEDYYLWFCENIDKIIN